MSIRRNQKITIHLLILRRLFRITRIRILMLLLSFLTFLMFQLLHIISHSWLRLRYLLLSQILLPYNQSILVQTALTGNLTTLSISCSQSIQSRTSQRVIFPILVSWRSRTWLVFLFSQTLRILIIPSFTLLLRPLRLLRLTNLFLIILPKFTLLYILHSSQNRR